MEILFIRHSKTHVNPEIPINTWGLSAKGIELAQHLSSHALIKQLEVLYTSFQTKALETALYLAKPNNIPIKANDDLTEVSSFTKQYEPDFELYSRRAKAYYHGKIERINEGESQNEALTRFGKILEYIVEIEGNKSRIGIVSHGHILTLYAALYREIDTYAVHTQIKQPDIAVFDWEKKTFTSFFGEVI